MAPQGGRRLAARVSTALVTADASSELVHNDREIAPRTIHLQIRDVADPDLIRRGRRGRPETIRMARVEVMNARLGAVPANGLRPESSHPHEMGNPSSTDGPAGGHHNLIEARASVSFLVQPEEASDLDREDAVLLRMRTLGTPAPGIKAPRRDEIAPTQRRYAETRALRVDEGERVGLRAEQNRMAFFRSSCSSSRRACAFSSACSLAISRAGPGGGAFGARPRNRPSRASFRHFESMNGWISSAVATVFTSSPDCWLNRTAVSLNSSLYFRTARGRDRGMMTLRSS